MWTSEDPTEPGWYFWRAKVGAALVPVYLDGSGPLLAERFYVCVGMRSADLLGDGEWWRMPVQPPEGA